MQLPHNHGQRIEREPEAIPQNEAFQAAAGIFRLLDDGTRLKIFWILCHYEECVVNLSALMGMSSPAVSHTRSAKQQTPAPLRERAAVVRGAVSLQGRRPCLDI